MDDIVESFVKAGYYRARISNLSHFDKIIGGMAWAMQLFSYDINIDVFYTDSLDLGQKIALTERLVMVLIALKCPYRLEPHQIVGLDYANISPAIRWLLERSEEVRREHAAFNRLLALRHYHRVTGTLPPGHGHPKWRHVIKVAHLVSGGDGDHESDHPMSPPSSTRSKDDDDDDDLETRRGTSKLLASINENFKDNKLVSFVKLATVMRASSQAASGLASNQHGGGGGVGSDSFIESELDTSRDSSLCDDDDLVQPQSLGQESTCFTDDDAMTTISEGRGGVDDGGGGGGGGGDAALSLSEVKGGTTGAERRSHELSREELELDKRLDLELLATNQKILNLLKKVDSMPGQLEICQYQRRYIELHQQLISRNKDVKKLFDLYNSLDVEKHYLERELNLLDSIGENLHLTNNSVGNRDLFMRQLETIITKIQSIRDDMGAKVDSLRRKCDLLNEQYEQYTV